MIKFHRTSLELGAEPEPIQTPPKQRSRTGHLIETGARFIFEGKTPHNEAEEEPTHYHSPHHHQQRPLGKVGWSTGFEPATARSTIWGSNRAELRPPEPANNLEFYGACVKFGEPVFLDCRVLSILSCSSLLVSATLLWDNMPGGIVPSCPKSAFGTSPTSQMETRCSRDRINNK